VEGVMRQAVINIAKKMNIAIAEVRLNPEILYEADEVFLTNASRGIQSVMGFGIRRYFNESTKLLIDELNKL
jgi:branched-chain amino acid aminotransferase